MNFLQNLHTHTTYCDGADTPEEMIKYALEKGFSSIGFSGHSYMYYAPSHSMSIEGTKTYKEDIYRLKEKYRGQIDVFCGLEYDMNSDVDMSGYEYLIGSVHYMPLDGQLVGFDRSQKEVERIIRVYFGGDGMRYAQQYYAQLAQLPQYGNFDILGHPDLITKHSENTTFFDMNSKQYLDYATQALEALAGKIPLFEVNTGAIARGYRTTPYPSIPLLKQLKRLGFGAVISSDCHDKHKLDQSFDFAREMLLHCGFREYYLLGNEGFYPIAL